MTATDHDCRVQRQFGPSAEHYRTSDTHARGQSLSRLLELTAPRPHWMALDAATGAGHMAAFLAPHTRYVVAGDITVEMLDQARLLFRDKQLSNVMMVRESAQALSYRDDVFDLVCCRVAAHHFANPALFVAESARVLKPGGILALIDNIVPEDRRAGDWINDFERRRDPSHTHCLALSEWRRLFRDKGLVVFHEEVSDKRFDFHEWMSRMRVNESVLARLDGELRDAPEAVRVFWKPVLADGSISLVLQEAILLGRKPGAT